MKSTVQISRELAGLVGAGGFRPFKGTFSVAAENSNNVDVTFQLTDAHGTPLKVANVPIQFYISVDTAGTYTGGTNVTTLSVPATGVRLANFMSGHGVLAATDSNGQIVVRCNTALATTRRLVAVGPGGMVIAQSGTMTWA